MNLLIIFSASSTLFFLFLGYFVYYRNRRNIINRLFMFYFFSLFLWSFGIFGLLSTKEAKVALIWVRILNIGLVFAPSFFFHFILNILGLKIKKKIYLAYIFSCCSLVLSFTQLFTKGVNKLSFGFVASPGLIFPLFLMGLVYFFGYGHYLLLRDYKKTAGIKQNQIKYVLVGSLIVLLGGLSVLPSIFGFVFLGGFPIWNFTNIAYGVILTYAILRYQLMDINIIIKKSTTYATVIALAASGYLAIIALSDYLFQTFIGHSSPIGRIIAVIVVAAIFHPLRNKVEAIIDKIFFRGKLDYQEAIAKFTRSLIMILDLRELLNLIISLSDILNTRQIAVFLFNADTAQYKIRASAGLDQIAKEVEFDAQSDLVRLLASTRKVVLRSKIESASANSDYPILHSEMDSLKAAIAIPIFIKDALKGILVLGEKLSEELYSKEDINMLTTLADEAGIAIDNAQLYGDLKRTYLETVQALSQAIEASDEYTRGHSDRVTKSAIQIAKQLELNRTDIDTLKFACILHDVGKIGIIKEVLNKPGKLNEAEFLIIKMHPALGEEIIAPVAFLAPISPIVRSHHERFDGRGYPDGLKGEAIPYLSRIIAVADTYDAMTSERPYRPALSAEIALAEIKKCAGSQFDPEIVKAFLELDHAI